MHGLNCRGVEIAELMGQWTLESHGGEMMRGINSFKNATLAPRIRKTQRAAGSHLQGQLSFPFCLKRDSESGGVWRCS